MREIVESSSILTLIPARAGSKRIPNKNIIDFCGKPLIEHTIEQAISAKMDFIVVSTDSQEIAGISKKAGARCDFLRPDYLSSDTATTVDVIIHALDFYKDLGMNFKTVLLLQPTSPLRSPKDIESSLQLFQLKKAISVVSVCELDHPSIWSGHLTSDLGMREFHEKIKTNMRSQDQSKEYRLNGSIYIVQTEILLQEKAFLFEDKSFAYIMERSSSVDIDTFEDLEYARYLMNRKAATM